jgi:hypothetical protein
MDLFGKQARQDLDLLQKAKMELELRYSDMVAKHGRISEELRESTELIAAINAAKKSKGHYPDREQQYHDEA